MHLAPWRNWKTLSTDAVRVAGIAMLAYRTAIQLKIGGARLAGHCRFDSGRGHFTYLHPSRQAGSSGGQYAGDGREPLLSSPAEFHDGCPSRLNFTLTGE